MLPQQRAGQRWAYREAAGRPLAEVEVLATGVDPQKPRVKIAFQDDAHEGRVEWVPAGRLKVRWSDRERFLEEERRWDDVQADGRPIYEEREAAWTVFFTICPDLMDLYYNGAMGIGVITDVDRLAAIAGIGADEIRASEGSFVEGGRTHIRWFLTRDIARRLAHRHPTAVLDLVQRDNRGDEAKYLKWAEDAEAYWQPLEETVQIYRDRVADLKKDREILKLWTGESENYEHQARAQLEADFLHLAQLAQQAATSLRYQRTKKAARLAGDIERAIRRERQR
ncbi:hypothetical protein [Rathayibacter sp. AY1A3]|uniref:hypothetical protein n=1 Tax=Rathayibacter sp. AY1A3 TaxID=2080521 RepID=UPI0011AFFBA8|nr:hypothetical protein [Rathayibacter sp. AY1A3]